MFFRSDRIYTLEELKAGRPIGMCQYVITTMEGVYRSSIYNTLAYERLNRKNRDVNAIHKESLGDWSQTLHVLLFRMLGGSDNQKPFDKLAHLVPHDIIAREGSSVVSIESLLLGASGLLNIFRKDDYIGRLKAEYQHLATKYNIQGMDASEWQLTHIYPNNHPALRLVQIAACYHSRKLSIHSVTACRSRQDLHKIFKVPTSEYWIRRIMPNANVDRLSRHIGTLKSDILGINVVAQINYAYGRFLGSDTIIESATNLLEDIPAEENRYIKGWNHYERIAVTAFESQALLQLSKEYCEKGACQRCPFARHLTGYPDED